MVENTGQGKVVAVTGASGFIGSYVVKYLVERGYQVRAVVRDTGNDAKCSILREFGKDAQYPLELKSGDIMVPGSHDEVFAGCWAVVHTAAKVAFNAPDPQRDIIDVAVEGTKNILESVRKAGVRYYVHTSSIAAVVGLPVQGKVYTEEDWNTSSDVHTDAYSTGKRESERYVWKFVGDLPEEEKINTVVVNPAYVCGKPLSKAHMVSSPQLIADLLLGTFPACPDLCFAWCHVRDVALAHVAGLEKAAELNGKRLIIASHSSVLLDAAKVIRDTYPGFTKVPTRRLWNWLMYVNAIFDSRVTITGLRHMLSVHYALDGSASEAALGWKYIGFEQCVVDTVDGIVELGIVPDKR